MKHKLAEPFLANLLVNFQMW